MWWLLGLIVGAAVGGALADGTGALLGALAGAAIVLALRRPSIDPRLEERLRVLEAGLARLAHRLDILQATSPVTSELRQSPTPEPADGTLSAPTVDALTPAEQFAQDAIGMPGDRSAAAVDPEPEPAEIEPAPAPAYVIAPPAQDKFDRFFARVRAWLFGGNTVVRVGVIILFFGVAFLLKFAFDLGLMPPELRVAGVGVGGIALAIVGWRLRNTRETYALTLQGAGVGVLYLAIFAALRLYEMIPAPLAFVLLAGLSIASTALALYQNSQALAVLAVSGGFLAPILTSSGSGNHVALFAYYGVINAGIVWLAARKPWRPLNLTGFFFTFGVAALWGAKHFRPELWLSVQPFLILFFLMYLAIPTLFARIAATRTAKYLDGTLVFGLPVVITGLQSQLVAHFEFGGAISALAASAIYLFAARIVRSRHGAALPVLIQSFAALCLMFATLAIPLALDARWTSAAWALEGAAMVWVGLRQDRWLARAAGCLLQVAAAVAFFTGMHGEPGSVPLFNRDGIGFLFLAVAGLFTAFLFERNDQRSSAAERASRSLVLVFGLIWWFGGGLHEIEAHAPVAWRAQLLLMFIVATAVAFEWVRTRLAWNDARFPALALVPLAMVALASQALAYAHPFQHWGYLAWPAMFGAHLWILRRREVTGARAYDWLHGAGLWLLAGVSAWEAGWAAGHVADSGSDWGLAAWIAAPAVLIAWLSTAGAKLAWPVAAWLRGYLVIGALPVVAGLLFWLVVASTFGTGGAAPLPYVPVLNPLDIGIAAALLAGLLWLRALSRHGLDRWIVARPWLRHGIPGSAAFIAANGVLIRALHQYAGVPVRFDAIMASMLAQAALSLFWTLLALVLMVLANRLHRRLLWFTGGALLGATVLKLFVIDLSNAAGGERIVSFVGVGVLMLVVGYLAPVPPRADATR